MRGPSGAARRRAAPSAAARICSAGPPAPGFFVAPGAGLFGGDLLGGERLAQRFAEHGVAVGVEIEHALGQIAARRRDAAGRRPAERRRRPADDERRASRRPRARARAPPPTRGNALNSPIEPAAFGAPRPRIAAFEHVLAVEMRTIAVAGRHGVDHGRALRVVHALEGRQAKDGRKEAVERQRGPFAGSGEGEIAVQRRRNPDRRPAERRTARRPRRAG